MAAKLPWFRTYVEMFHDVKIRRLPVEQRWTWMAVLGAARMSPTPGRLMLSATEPMIPADIADLAGVPVRKVEAAFKSFEQLGMIVRDGTAWAVAKWSQRQFEGDYSRDFLPPEMRQAVLERDAHRCVECGATEELQIDHVTPRTKGGATEIGNLQVLCGSCNRRKGNRIRQQRHRERNASGDRDVTSNAPSRHDRCHQIQSQSQIQKTEEPLAPIVETQPSLLPAVIDKPATPARRRDPLFDALVDACGYRYDEMTERQTKACGVARSQLAKVGATPEQIAERARIYGRKFPNASLTPTAIANQWAALNPDRQRQTSSGPQLGKSAASFVAVGERLRAGRNQ